MREAGLQALFVFIAPPSDQELEKRLRGRGTETEEQIQQRMTNAKAEISRQAASQKANKNYRKAGQDQEKCWALHAGGSAFTHIILGP